MKTTLLPVKLMILFILTLSFTVLPISLTSLNAIPSIPAVHASSAPVEAWYPGGPAMDTLIYKIYTDENAEFTDLQLGNIDLTDWALTPTLISNLTPNSNYFVTAPISEAGYVEVEFHLGSIFWNCNMGYGSSACGKEIRQAFAHALDKNVFTATEPSIAGVSVPVDNPVPPSVGLTVPNPCNWDATHVETGSNCVVGEGGNSGGVAYHLATSNNPTLPYPWIPAIGSLDFCAAADHLIAAGIASAKNADCTLTGHITGGATNPPNISFPMDSTPVLHGGESLAEFICALFTGAYTVGCTNLTTTLGTITNFTGFQTSPTQVNQGWNVYINHVSNIPSFDQSLYYRYDSRFVSGIASIQPPNGPCSSLAVPSYEAPNYLYLCDSTYDSLIGRAEFAPCLSASGDPSPGQVTPSFADCSSTTLLTATSASYQAQDEFGKNAFTIPWYSGRNQFAYLSNWQRVALQKANGLTPPGTWQDWLNAWSPNPAQTGTIRQGYREPPVSVDPFTSTTPWDLGLQSAIWDTPNISNPADPQSTLDWMTTSTQVLQNNQLTYTPAPGTVQTYRYTFRNDIFWQTGQSMTAWDAAFSYIAFKSLGVAEGTGLAPMVGVKVLSRSQMDVNINNFGPFTGLTLSTVFILPARFWLPSSEQASWDAAASNPDFAGANAALTPLIGSSTTASGVILPTVGTSAVDPNKILPGYDPIASGTFVGSGPWVCKSSAGVIGQGCSSTGTQSVAPGGSFTLQRYGYGSTPGGTINSYFRSSSNTALCIWTGDCLGTFIPDFQEFSVIDLCFGQPLQPLGSTTGCAHWQQGIGAPGGYAVVGLTQVGIAQRFFDSNWVSPYKWGTSPPAGIASFPPLLYEGVSTGNPGNPFPLGSSQTLNPSSVAGCSSSYPAGGYDC
jgi:hypothetical protein